MGDGTINHPLITQPICHKNQSIGVNQLLTPLHLNALWTWLWHIWDSTSMWHVGGIAILHDFCKTNDKVNLIYYWNTILCHHQFAHYYIIWNQKSKYLKIVWGVKLQCKSFAKTPTNELFKSLKKNYVHISNYRQCMRLEVFVLSEIQIRARLCNFLFTCSKNLSSFWLGWNFFLRIIST